MWWKLKTEGCCEEFRKDLRQTLGGREELPGDDQRAAVWLRAETTDVCFESVLRMDLCGSRELRGIIGCLTQQ